MTSSIRDNAREIFKTMLRAGSEPEMPKDDIIEVIMPPLEKLGFSIKVYDNNGNPAIYASTPNPQVLLSGHLDTVSMGSGWNYSQAEEVEGRIYGRGSLDMKGPCLSMLIAAEHLLAQGLGIAIAYTTDEEVGMHGAKVLAARHPEISTIPLVIICEPTGLRPVFDEKGLVQFKITAHGTSAHGSMPELGKNAILDLNRAIDDLIGSSIFGQTSTDPVTISIGKVCGGTLINMVADRAEAEFDVRYSPENSGSQIIDEVKRVLAARELEYDIEIIREIRSASSEFSDQMTHALEELFGQGMTVPYATEMAIFCELNSKIFVLGPGEPGRAHKPDEFMTIEEIREGAEAIIKASALSSKF